MSAECKGGLAVNYGHSLGLGLYAEQDKGHHGG
jgi:hypothetical protein